MSFFNLRSTVWALGLAVLLPAGELAANDWPMYRQDAARSGVSQETVALPLSAAWSYQPATAPRPAWPEPGKETHRVDFDYAPQPIVAAGRVYFGSSVDDALRALDAATGRLLWKFVTGGPIRFAPAYDRGCVYCASDDGFVYCLSATTGALQWKFNAAGTNAKVLGNGRMISIRPLRSGLLVDQDTLYVTAGMWPSEGVLIYALAADTGAVRWCNDTSDTLYLPQPHAAAYSLTGLSPQGYLLASPELLLIPTGRGVPAALDRKTGRLRYFRPSDSKSHGGVWATIAGDRLFNGGLVYTLEDGRQIECPDTGVPLWAKRDYDFGTRQHVLGYRGGQVMIRGDEIYGRRAGHSLALSGKLLWEGGADRLQAFDTTSKHAGEVVWEASLPGGVRGIAISDGRVFAATDQGTIHCFAPDAGAAERQVTDGQPPGKAPAELIDPTVQNSLELLSSRNIDRGHAVVVGNSATSLSLALARRTSLRVLQLVEEDRVEKVRAELLPAVSSGAQVSVMAVERLTAGDLPDYFANAVFLADPPAEMSGEELWRVVRPCGGLLAILQQPASSTKGLLQDVEDAPQSSGSRNGLVWHTRGKLPGALDWDSETAVDLRVKWPLQLSWFGGPGPARMQDRHRTSVATPVAAGGRYFIAGERHVIAVDAYNGTELWSHDFTPPVEANSSPVRPTAPLQLTGLSADDDVAYLRINERWLRLNANSGAPLGPMDQLPEKLGEWGRPPRREAVSVPRLRKHALTGEQTPRIYYRAYGCNQVLCSAEVDFFRSGTLGFYDLIDDSGLRNFGGVRPACSRSHNAALGIFISSEGSSGCSCTYNFQTSLALAPARRRRSEDWAVYYDLPAEGLIQHAAINLAAPGDRRDERGRMWLNYPRPELGKVLQLPVKLESETAASLGPYHFDSDRQEILGTTRPWIYGSGYRGLRRLTLAVDQRQPVISQTTPRAVVLDGKLTADEWPAPQRKLLPSHNRQNLGAPNRPLIDPAGWQTELFVKHEPEHLCVAFSLPNQVDRRGQPYAWRQVQTKRDSGVWTDDSFELFLSDHRRQVALHLAVSAAGVVYDARHAFDPEEKEDLGYNANWQAAVTADEQRFCAELKIPWSMLTAAGLARERLTLNAQANWSGWRMPLRFLGSRGGAACENFSPLGLGEPPESEPRRLRVRLYFAEPDDIAIGDRRFDLLVQGKPALSNFDVLRESGGQRRALVREVLTTATDALTIELQPRTPAGAANSETILSGVEVEAVE